MMKESRKDKRKNRSGKIWIVSGIAAIIILVCFSLYVSDYYHSDSYVKDYLSGTENVKVNKEDFGLFLDGPGEEAALVFYPGAKVEYTAYLPMLSLLAERRHPLHQSIRMIWKGLCFLPLIPRKI